MEILCQNCGHAFDSPLENIGQIHYTESKNIFRVEYGVKIPCPACKEILKILPDQSMFVGIPIAVFSKKGTDADKVVPQEEPTHRSHVPLTFDEAVDEESTIIRPAPKRHLKKRFSTQTLQNISMGASVLLFMITLVFVFKNERSIQDVSKKIDTVSKYYEEEYNIPPENNAPYIPLDSMPLGESDLPSDADFSLGGLQDEQMKQMEMSEKQLMDVKKTKSDLQILHLPPLRKVTSSYGVRLDPFTKRLAFHGGIDFRGKTGTNIHAALDGVVEIATYDHAYGNYIVIKHKKGYKTLYAHLEKILVEKGQEVSRKDVIGLLGSTGRSTGPHLHFELHHRGKKKDPLQADLIPID